MPMLPSETLETITLLQKEGVDPILYGSQGVSLYIGQFKRFGDADFLVDSPWLSNEWDRLVSIMAKLGFFLVDEHEHEFQNDEDMRAAFADTSVLARDGIADPLDEAVQIFDINGVRVRTLRAETFKKAYEFSEKDGYRRELRGKNDRIIIGLIDNYLAKKQGDDSAAS